MTATNHAAYPPGLRPQRSRRAALRHALASDLVVAPGCYDCLTGRLVERAGFAAAYVTGSGLSMSAMGAPDVGLVSFGEVMERVRRIAAVVDIPLIADIDTGYGGPLNVIRTVREMEAANVAAVQIEDQVWPKKCGHEPGRRLVATAEMADRIKAAVDARVDDDFVVIARTDARTTHGLAAALERAEAYGEAGADVLFVESPESAQEMQAINDGLARPTMANMVEGGRTPILPVEELRRLGYRLVIYPNSLTRTFARMGALMLDELRNRGRLDGFAEHMVDHRQLWNLFDYDDWVTLENQFLQPPDEPR